MASSFSRLLTGIQSTGVPHLGNILGAIMPMIDLSNSSKKESLFFIADLHALTQIKDSKLLKENTYSLAASCLALGLDVEKVIFYRQSDVPEVNELAWYLSAFFPYNRLKLAHSFKDKAARLEEVNVGLFTYPMLMAADILLYSATEVPVGKDQLQHIEMTRLVAENFNKKMGETFALPKANLQAATQYVFGIDGEKMSKSRNNFINVFAPEKELKKQIMSIQTDAKPIEEPKDPEATLIYKIYKAVASKEQTHQMAENFTRGGYGYAKAKMNLFECILNKFSEARITFDKLIKNQEYLDETLKEGANKAKKIARNTLGEIRKKFEFSKLN